MSAASATMRRNHTTPGFLLGLVSALIRVIKHIVDGEPVLEYEQPQLDDRDPEGHRPIKNGETLHSGGSISLQAESHPIEFRKVEILPLKE